MYWAMGVEPTKLTALTRGSVRMVSTASLSPLTTFSTPAGAPAWIISSASRSGTDGSFSDGFSTKVLPHAMATANIHMGTMAGKLNGVMPAHTPSGLRMEYMSIWRDTLSENSPFMKCGMPQANSTTSRPRWTSPTASRNTLPCSDARVLASASFSAVTSSRNLNITRDRLTTEVVDQSANASCAAAMAASTSAWDARLTRACTSPVDGLNTSPNRPDEPSAGPPFT